MSSAHIITWHRYSIPIIFRYRHRRHCYTRGYIIAKLIIDRRSKHLIWINENTNNECYERFSVSVNRTTVSSGHTGHRGQRFAVFFTLFRFLLLTGWNCPTIWIRSNGFRSVGWDVKMKFNWLRLASKSYRSFGTICQSVDNTRTHVLCVYDADRPESLWHWLLPSLDLPLSHSFSVSLFIVDSMAIHFICFCCT